MTLWWKPTSLSPGHLPQQEAKKAEKAAKDAAQRKKAAQNRAKQMKGARRETCSGPGAERGAAGACAIATTAPEESSGGSAPQSENESGNAGDVSETVEEEEQRPSDGREAQRGGASAEGRPRDWPEGCTTDATSSSFASGSEGEGGEHTSRASSTDGERGRSRRGRNGLRGATKRGGSGRPMQTDRQMHTRSGGASGQQQRRQHQQNQQQQQRQQLVRQQLLLHTDNRAGQLRGTVRVAGVDASAPCASSAASTASAPSAKGGSCKIAGPAPGVAPAEQPWDSADEKTQGCGFVNSEHPRGATGSDAAAAEQRLLVESYAAPEPPVVPQSPLPSSAAVAGRSGPAAVTREQFAALLRASEQTEESSSSQPLPDGSAAHTQAPLGSHSASRPGASDGGASRRVRRGDEGVSAANTGVTINGQVFESVARTFARRATAAHRQGDFAGALGFWTEVRRYRRYGRSSCSSSFPLEFLRSDFKNADQQEE